MPGQATLVPAVSASIFALALDAHAAVQINEFQPNPSGSDPADQTIELRGGANQPFSGWLLAIESDSGSTLGNIERAEFLSGTFAASGLLSAVVGDLENPSFTLVLLDSFTGSTGTDIDADDDGIVDGDPSGFGFGSVLDAIGVPDQVGDESNVYGAQLGGTDLAYVGSEPQLVFRDSGNGEWLAVAESGSTLQVFDVLGNMVDPDTFSAEPTVATFAAVNPTSVVPVPAAAWLFGPAVLGLISLARLRT